jgi:release factor glutamine methyltransferase
MPTVSETLRAAAEILRASEIAEPRREAASLLALALRRDRTFLITRGDYELTAEEEKLFREFLRRRARHEPLQYIRGEQEFYGLNFAVTPDVLIPRPETELIVEHAIEILRNVSNPHFCEVGTGSGCISVAILHEFADAAAIGLDVSEKALAVTRENAARHRVAERFELKISDVFENLSDENFDLIVSNPPYVPATDMATLQAEVRDFEPRVALTDGTPEGVSIIEKIVFQSPRFLKSGGFLLMEIGFNQAGKVSAMFDRKIWRRLEILPDLQGVPRVVKARTAS